MIPITHISYSVFEQIMGYLYRGEFNFREGDEENVDSIIDILRVADEEFLDDVSNARLSLSIICNLLNR